MRPPLHPKTKGELTEAIIRAELMKFGHVVLRPEGDNQRYDLVLDTHEGFKRVQCKTGSLEPNGNVNFACASIRGNAKGFTRRPYTKTEIDLFAVYCYENDEVYLIPIEHVPNKSQCSLRTKPLPKTGAGGKRILYAFPYALKTFQGLAQPIPDPNGGWKAK